MGIHPRPSRRKFQIPMCSTSQFGSQEGPKEVPGSATLIVSSRSSWRYESSEKRVEESGFSFGTKNEQVELGSSYLNFASCDLTTEYHTS